MTLAAMGYSSHAIKHDHEEESRSAPLVVTKSNLRRAQENVIYEDIPDMSDADIKEVMDWIATEVGMVKNPFCWKRSYGRGVGTLPGRVADCPSGYTNTGLTCTRPPKDIRAPPKRGSCPKGYSDTGVACFRGLHSFKAKVVRGDCPSGYTSIGVTCKKKT